MVRDVGPFREELIPGPGGWEWLDVDRRHAPFGARVGHPFSIGRKHGVGGIRRVDGAEGRRLPVLQREGPQRHVGPLRDAEQESVAVRRPGLRRMRFARLRRGEAFRGAAVGRLPEDGEVAVAVRLKRDALAVRRPDRKTVVAAGRESLHRARPGQVVDPDDRLLVVVVRRRRCACRPETRAATRTAPGGSFSGSTLPLRSIRPIRAGADAETGPGT